MMEGTSIEINWADFSKIDIRVGTVISAELFAEVKKPAYKMVIDFGELGLRKTSAQITKQYTVGEMIGKQVTAVVNFPPKQIANIFSECLILGAVGDENVVTLLTTERPVQNGLRVG